MGANYSTEPRIFIMECPRSQEQTTAQSPSLEAAPSPPPPPIMATPAPALEPIPPPAPETFICKNCKVEKHKDEQVELKQKPTSPELPKAFISVPVIAEQKVKEIDEEEFERTLAKLEKTIGKPIDWTAANKVELNNLKTNLMQCYQQNPKEPLSCHSKVKNFENFVYDKQYKTILKQKLGAGDEK